MFREVFANRKIVIGVGFLVLIVGVTQLYSWHVRRETAAEVKQIDQAKQYPENEKHTAQDIDFSVGPDRIGKREEILEVNNTQASPETAKALPRSKTSDYLDIGAAFLFDETVEEASAEKIRVSPFGFGPYPEVPLGYPNPNLWDYAEALYEFSPERARNWELRERVCIELWKQGKRSESVAMENGLVYPCYPNTIYVRWGEDIDEDGTPVVYIEELLAPASMSHHTDDFDNDIIPPGITVIPYDEGGIDPYAFLDLN